MFPLLIVSIILLGVLVVLSLIMALIESEYRGIASINIVICTVAIIALSLSLSNLP